MTAHRPGLTVCPTGCITLQPTGLWNITFERNNWRVLGVWDAGLHCWVNGSQRLEWKYALIFKGQWSVWTQRHVQEGQNYWLHGCNKRQNLRLNKKWTDGTEIYLCWKQLGGVSSLQTFTTGVNQMTVFWVITACSLVSLCRRFEETCCLLLRWNCISFKGLLLVWCVQHKMPSRFQLTCWNTFKRFLLKNFLNDWGRTGKLS